VFFDLLKNCVLQLPTILQARTCDSSFSTNNGTKIETLMPSSPCVGASISQSTHGPSPICPCERLCASRKVSTQGEDVDEGGEV
jgi:hypothetical protein